MLGLFNSKIGSRLQINLFFSFYQNFQPPPPTYLILPNVPTPPLPQRLLGQLDWIIINTKLH